MESRNPPPGGATPQPQGETSIRYTVTKQRIKVLGRIWWPYGAVAAIQRELSTYDLENLTSGQRGQLATGDPRDRDDVEAWVHTHCGDFSQVIDFRADFHLGDEQVVHDWSREESECEFTDCMYPMEE